MYYDVIVKLQSNMQNEIDKEFYPVDGPSEGAKRLGVVTVGNMSYLITADHSWIYANNKVIMPTYNDWYTAMPIVKGMLQAFYNDAFTPCD